VILLFFIFTKTLYYNPANRNIQPLVEIMKDVANQNMKALFSICLFILICGCTQREEVVEPDTLPGITEAGAKP